MLKCLFLFLLINTIQFEVFSQVVEYFSMNQDSVYLYIDCNGSLTTNNKAKYTRVVRFEKERLAFIGAVKDHYKNGSLAFKAYYKNGLYNGPCTAFYTDGNIKEKGKYTDNNRDSVWSYFYENGIVEKKVDFTNKQTRLLEYYKKNGQPVFINGNGTYKGQSNKDYSSCDLYPIHGEIKNGLMDGRWTINFGYSRSNEIFESGRFLRGQESAPYNRTYESGSLISLSGFPYYENISLLQYSWWCSKQGFFYPEYDNKIFIESFLVELRKSIKESHLYRNKLFFYALLEFKLENGKIDNNSFKSVTNNSSILDSLKIIIGSLDKWNKNKEDASFIIYLPVFWDYENIYLKPEDINKFSK